MTVFAPGSISFRLYPHDLEPVRFTSFGEFERAAGPDISGFLPIAVRGFFENGGRDCYVALSAASNPIDRALEALAEHRCSLLCCPDEAQFPGAAHTLVSDAERRKDLICLLQLSSATPPSSPDCRSSYAAFYYPSVVVAGVDGQRITVPAGSYEAMKLDLQLNKIGGKHELQPHKKFRRATIWLSDDADRLVLRVEAQVFIGTVFTELQSLQFDEPPKLSASASISGRSVNTFAARRENSGPAQD